MSPGSRAARLSLAAFGIAATMLLPAPGVAIAAGQTTLIHAGRLLDPRAGSVTDGVDILIEGNRIRAVGPELARPDGAVEIDLRDMTVLPGLIDSHTHICLTPADGVRSPKLYKTDPFRALEGLEAAGRDLAAGFTTLRDLDNEGADMADIAVRDALAAGLFEGPRLFVSGWAISITGGHMNLTGLAPAIDRRLPQLAIMADDRDAMIAAVRDQVKSGVDFIKVYATGTIGHLDPNTLEPLSQFSVDEIRLMVDEAARWGMDVAAHAYGGEGAYNAVAGGARSIEHGMLLDDRTLDLMAARGTYWCPTMKVYFPGEGDDPDRQALLTRVVERHRDTFVRAMRKKVAIAFGTDVGALPHGEAWRELELMAEYGMAPIEVIRSATVTGARLLRRETDLGLVAPGYLADIIAVKGRPDERIDALRDVSFVMADGRVVKAVRAATGR